MLFGLLININDDIHPLLVEVATRNIHDRNHPLLDDVYLA